MDRKWVDRNIQLQNMCYFSWKLKTFTWFSYLTQTYFDHLGCATFKLKNWSQLPNTSHAIYHTRNKFSSPLSFILLSLTQ